MDAMACVEQTLSEALDRGEGPGAPPRLGAAMRYAVFPGGQRIRPRLCLAVSAACGNDNPKAAAAAAAAIELLHCASLVHDDLPCFDDAEMRRGKPSVHRAFDERLAVLAGDALIIMAFDTIAHGAIAVPQRLAALLQVLSRAVGMPMGIAAGQAWECEPRADLSAYHEAKTGALFSGAAVAGAASAGATDPEAWRAFGDKLGEAYQVADDIRDVAGKAEELGKPVGRDKALGRPNAAIMLGLPGAVARLEGLVQAAMDEIPACPGRDALAAQMRAETQKFLPQKIWELAA